MGEEGGGKTSYTISPPPPSSAPPLLHYFLACRHACFVSVWVIGYVCCTKGHVGLVGMGNGYVWYSGQCRYTVGHVWYSGSFRKGNVLF